VIVAFSSAIYFNLEVQSEPDIVPPDDGEEPVLADFLVYGLTVSPSEVTVGNPVTVTVKVSNVGQGPGNYTAELRIDGAFIQNETVEVQPTENKTIQFNVIKNNVGTYSITIGDLAPEIFEVTSTPSQPPPVEPPPTEPPPPTNGEAKFSVFDLSLNRKEAWVGQEIWITTKVRNVGTVPGSHTVELIINNQLRDSKTVELIAGQSTTVEFRVTESKQGTYTVEISDDVARYDIGPDNHYTLSITTGQKWGVDFTIDGVPYVTPIKVWLPTGEHNIVMPQTDDTGVYVFLQWEDMTKNPVRTIQLYSPKQLIATYSGGSSCPSLFMWNGTDHNYVAEVSNHGWLGYINYINEDGSIVYWRNDPWDYLKLDTTQLGLKNGNYELLLTQRWNEIFYLDAAYMMVVDHPTDVDVFSTGVEQYLDPKYMGKIYSVSKNPLTPILAINEDGQNVLPLISEIDGKYTPGKNGLQSISWNNITWNTLTLDLGDLSEAEQIKLIVTGMVDWGHPEDYNNWLNGFFAQTVPNGTQITPPPYMEVKDANGEWLKVPESRQFPIPPDVTPRTWIVDLTGLFPTNDYSLRINNFWNVTFDCIAVDTSSQSDLVIQRLDPYASLYQAFIGNSVASGNFTRYGDVTELILTADDEYVIGRQGDEVSLLFPVNDIPPLEENMERDIFLFVSCWFKDEYGNWGFGFGFTVDPMPFLSMSGFPYPDTESYPYQEHLDYLTKYNTRIITVP
jgi:hypothetical protein